MDPALEQTIRDAYEAFGKGEAHRVHEFFHEDAEYVNPPYAIEPGVRRGHDELTGVWESVFALFEFGEVTIDEILEGSNAVLVAVRYDGRGKGSGAPVEFPMLHVLEFCDNRVTRLSWFVSREEAAAAAGL